MARQPWRSRLALLKEGERLDSCVRTMAECGIMYCVPIPLIRGFHCWTSEAGDHALASEPAISHVEADSAVHLTTAVRPELLRQAPSLLPDGIRAIRARSAWFVSKGEGIGVAIFDTGIDLSHPDLAENVAGGINLITPGADPRDDHGHGTHVAGIVGAVGHTSAAVGVAPRAQLFAVKVLDARGDGLLSAVIRGLQWVVDQRIPVANLSLDVPQHSEALGVAVANAVKAGTTIVASTGNWGRPNSVTYPAVYPEVIAVSAASPGGTLAAFSSTGPEVDLIAPGVNVWSTVPYRRYGRSSGTSVASPHVAGVAALYLALHPGEPPTLVREALKATAVPLPGLTAEQQGAGRVDAWNAVNYSHPMRE